MRRLGLIVKRGKLEGLALARELVAHCGRRRVQVVCPEGTGDLSGARTVPEADFARAIDLLAVLGGDGTLLYAAGLVGDAGVPILGVNLGSLGFLTAFAVEEASAAIDRALRDALPIEERMRLEVRVRHGNRTYAVRHAINDAVLSQGALARLIQLEAHIGAARVTTYRADGLIVSTPSGSTAYTLAAGGPILTPDLDAMVVTPICPFTLTNRPLVIPGRTRLRITVGATARNVVLTVDGQWGIDVAPGDQVLLKRARRPLRLYRSPRDYFEILRTKLHWGRGV